MSDRVFLSILRLRVAVEYPLEEASTIGTYVLPERSVREAEIPKDMASVHYGLMGSGDAVYGICAELPRPVDRENLPRGGGKWPFSRVRILFNQ